MINKVIDFLPKPIISIGINIIGAKQRRERYSRSMLEILRKWKSYEKIPLEIIEEHQLLAFKKTLRIASQTPFYAKRFKDSGFDPETFSSWDELKNIPILTRKDIQDNSELMVLRDSPDQIVRRYSSGTTGKRLGFEQPRILSTDFAFAALYQFYSWYGIAPLDSRATLAGRYLGVRPKSGIVVRNIAENQLLLSTQSLSEDSVASYILALNKFSPKFMQAHPSALLMLMNFADRKGVKLNKIPVISVTGETLLEKDRITIEEWFGAKVFAQYGSGEHHLASSECRFKNGYHMNPMFSVTELVPSHAGNSVVSTSLLNNVMPLIRYQIGDIAERIDKTVCPCGCTWPRLVGLSGRSDDVLSSVDGRPLAPVVFRTALAARFPQLPQYTIVQEKTIGCYTLKIYSTESSSKYQEVGVFLGNLLGVGSHVSIDIIHPSILASSGSKHKLVIKN